MMGVIIGWRMYELTHDPLHLGLIGLAEAIPALSLALYAGSVVDRSRPLFVYSNVVLGALLSTAAILVSQVPGLFGVAWQMLALYLASFISGAARGFSQPSIYATVPRIVPRDLLPRASAWNASAMQMARIAGPALGGILFGLIGVPLSATLACLFLTVAYFSLFTIKTPLPALPRPSSPEARGDIFSGAAFVFKHPILFPALTLDMVAVLFGGVTALLPIYASDILRVGPVGLGVLRAAPAVGAGLTSLWLTRRDIRSQAGAWLFSSVTGFGVSILVFALSRDFTLSLIALGFSGAFDSVSMVIRSSAVQLSSPASMRGRISAVNSIFIGSSNELGEFESGVAAKFMGTVPAAVMGGLVCLLTVAVVAVLSPSLRHLHLGRLSDANT